MCGIAGHARLGGPSGQAASLRDALVAELHHRGPDDEGFWADDSGRVALGMRRLSIVDIERGRQPQMSEDGRIVVVCNGEIYNHLQLREELTGLGHIFASDHSDTEVLVHGFEQWGAGCFDRLRGMFAAAIWDRESATLTLARDPIGKKPLYWHANGKGVTFASEATALESALGLESIDRVAVDQVLRHGYVHGGSSIWSGVRMLEAGGVLEIHNGEPSPVKRTVAPRPRSGGRDPGTVEVVDRLLRQAVRRRLQADVQVGIFLSGGLDSSLVAALATQEGGKGLRAFSATFEGAREDESGWSRRVAGYLGCEYRPVVCQSVDEETIRLTVRALDEPLADAAAIPTLALARAAVEDSYKVVLTGEGADELFLGYDHYATLARVSPAARLLRFSPVRPAGGRRARTVPYLALAAICGRLAEGVAERFSSGELSELGWQPEPAAKDAAPDPVTSAAIADLERFLPFNLLMKVDKVTMSQGLEARVPFLDRDLVDFAARLPIGERLGGGRRPVLKALLREVALRYLPAEVVNRPKHAFLTPTDDWVKSCPEAARCAAARLMLVGISLEPGALIPGHPDAISGLTRRQRWALFILGLWLDEHPQARLDPPPRMAS